MQVTVEDVKAIYTRGPDLHHRVKVKAIQRLSSTITLLMQVTVEDVKAIYTRGPDLHQRVKVKAIQRLSSILTLLMQVTVRTSRPFTLVDLTYITGSRSSRSIVFQRP